MTEEWKSLNIEPFNLKDYEISNMGVVRNIDNSIMIPIFDKRAKKWIYKINNTKYFIHLFVAMLFVLGKSEINRYVIHVNGNKKNNKYTNLKWHFQKIYPTFDQSFASHPNAIYWDYEQNKVKPRDVFKSSNTKYWFNCDKCPHSFDVLLYNITNIDSSRWCPYCSLPPHKLCNGNCDICYNKSFASHPRAKDWNYEKNNGITPRDVFKSSNTKYWFNCDKCPHSFDISLSNIRTGGWCPLCKKKGEAKLKQFLETIILEENIIYNKKNNKHIICKNPHNNKFLPYDFIVILNNKIKVIIELDGD